jgi:cysteinyl-tRNA synthetase
MYRSILDCIGNTPLVEIKRLNPNSRVKILAKLEFMNPGGSIKDRAAVHMIEAGENSGALTADKIVIEATSGNTGIGLAMVCAIKGYRLLLAMSEAASVERQKILKARGAEILLTPGHLGTDGAIEEVYRLVRENPDRYFMTDQYNNPANWQAHYLGTGPEIWEQTGGNITMLVATIGTSGTLMGLSRKLKELNPDIRIVGVEPYLGHKLQGLKNMKEAYRPGIFDKNHLDKKVNIEDENAFEMTRRLAKEEGLFVGMSSGAAMYVAQNEAQLLDSGTIVVIFPDSGERYLSTSLFTVREKIELKLFNSLSRKKEPFEPLVPGKASVYSCGPTAHARMNICECRRFIFSDLLCRYLQFRGHDVTHVMNITDLDDKTIEGSEAAGESLADFTGRNISSIKTDLQFLGIRPASNYPLASQHIDDMVALAEILAKKGYAYEKLRSLYFDISRFPEYGKLSGIDLNKIKVGATVDLDDYEKENPRDFTLFKRARLSELKRGIYTKTPWGNARPSWHIQCSAMAMKYLGESFDIHAAGRQLIFPHHENEIAISMAVTGKPLAKYWLHCDQVFIRFDGGQEKGDAVTLEHLTEKGFTGRQIRYWLLSNHYRKPLRFSEPLLKNAATALGRIDACIGALRQVESGSGYAELDQLLYDVKQGFINAMDDDLNISAAMASLFRHIKRINLLIRDDKLDPGSAAKLLDAFDGINSVLNIFDFSNRLSNPEIRSLIRQRENARSERNWELADSLRGRLQDMGVVIRDEKLDFTHMEKSTKPGEFQS